MIYKKPKDSQKTCSSVPNIIYRRLKTRTAMEIIRFPWQRRLLGIDIGI